MELFAKIINGFYLLTIFTKSVILDVRQCSEYAPEGSKMVVATPRGVRPSYPVEKHLFNVNNKDTRIISTKVALVSLL